MKQVKPITPAQVQIQSGKLKSIPNEVFNAFNRLIVQHWNGYDSTFTQSDVVKQIIIDGGPKEEVLLANHFLDVEPFFQQVGWNVVYDKPGFDESGFNESYTSTFKFTIKF